MRYTIHGHRPLCMCSLCLFSRGRWRPIDAIVIHSADTRKRTRVDVTSLRRTHRLMGLLDVGYHYVITETGELQEGRSLTKSTPPTLGPEKSIGICMVGTDFTGAQLKTLKSIVYQLKCHHPDARVIGHTDLPSTFSVKAWLNNVGLAST